MCSLTQVAPFQSGRDVEDYDYSTDEEEGGKSSVAPPVMPNQLIDSDREEEAEEWDEGGAGTAAEKLQVTTCLRRAFEEEEVGSLLLLKITFHCLHITRCMVDEWLRLACVWASIGGARMPLPGSNFRDINQSLTTLALKVCLIWRQC